MLALSTMQFVSTSTDYYALRTQHGNGNARNIATADKRNYHVVTIFQ